MSLKDRLLRGSASMLVLRLFSMALMLFLNGLLTRLMPPEEVGSYVAASNLMILLSQVGMWGLNQAILRIVSGKKDGSISDSTLIWKCWKFVGLATLVVSLLAYVSLRTGIAELLNLDSDLVSVIVWGSVLISVHKMFAASLRSRHAIASSSILEGKSGGPLGNSLYVVVLLVFAAGSLTAKGAISWFLLAMAVTSPIGMWMLWSALKDEHLEKTASKRRSPATQTDGVGQPAAENRLGAQVDSIFLFSTPFLASQLLTYLSTEFDVLLASTFASEEATALYGTSRRLILQGLAPLQIITVTLGSTIAQLYAQDNRASLQKTLSFSALIGSATTIPVLIVCLLAPEFILSLVFGDYYANASRVFVILAIGQFSACFAGQANNLLMLSGHTRIALIVKSFGAVAIVVVGSLATRKYGVEGLALTSSVILVVQNIALWWAAHRTVGYWTHPSLRGLMKSRPASV